MKLDSLAGMGQVCLQQGVIEQPADSSQDQTKILRAKTELTDHLQCLIFYYMCKVEAEGGYSWFGMVVKCLCLTSSL